MAKAKRQEFTLSDILTPEEMKLLSGNKKALEVCETYLANCVRDGVGINIELLRKSIQGISINKAADQQHLYLLFSTYVLKRIENRELTVDEVIGLSSNFLKNLDIHTTHSPLAVALQYPEILTETDKKIEEKWLNTKEKVKSLIFEPVFGKKLQSCWDRVLKLLESPSIKNDRGQTFLQYVVESGNDKLLSKILDPREKWILEKDLLEQDAEGNSLLHLSITKGNQEITKILAKNKALLELKNMFGQTPLLLACKEGKIETMEILLREEADVTAKDKDENGALHHMANYNGLHKGDGKGPQRLLNYLGIYNRDYSINQKNREGITPFVIALQHRNLPTMEKLYDYDNKCCSLTSEEAKEAFLDAVSKGDMKIFDFFDFRTKGKNIFENVKDKKGNNALNVAAASGMTEAVKHIMKHNSFTEVTKGKTTPLHLSCKNDHLPLTAFLAKNRRYNDVSDEDGNLPLHIAIAEGEKDLTIIEHVIDALKPFPELINFKNKAGKTPLDIAIEKGDKKIAELLEDVEALTSTGKTLKQAIGEDKPIFSFEDKIKKQREEPKEQGHARS